MSPELECLVGLQRLDTTIADARASIASHPQRLAATEARLASAQLALDTAKQRQKENQESRRALEKEAAVFQGRLAKFKDQLSAVKTNREYQAIQVEIETAQKELGDAEERVLERMVEADALTLELKQADAAFATDRKEVDAEKAALDTQLAAVQRTLTDAVEARAALAAQIDARLLARYDQVSKIRKGVALCTATRDGLCSFCHVRLRPPVFQQVRHNDSIVQCESCHRILYYIPPPPHVEAPVSHAP